MKFLILLFFISSCSLFGSKPTPPMVPFNRQLLVGHWYGESTQPNQVPYKWLIHRKMNGEYVVTFKYTNDKTSWTASYAGFWGATGNIYFTTPHWKIIKNKRVPLDRVKEPFDWAYKIVSLNDQEFVFLIEEFGFQLKVNKVAPTFVIP